MKPNPEQLKQLQELNALIDANPLLWGIHYCPRHFGLPSPAFHMAIMKAVSRNKYLAVAAPRESSKSTILAFLKPAHVISQKQKHFIIIVSNTYAKSCGALATIKDEFATNAKLQDRYRIGVLKDSEGDTIFVHPDGFKTRVLCKGHEQIGSIRGEKFGPYRPDLIIGDDLEDDIMVRSKERREQLQEEFDNALIPAGDKKSCQYIIIGTILHDDSLMAKLVSLQHYTNWGKYLYRALNEVAGKEVSLWADKWSADDLNKIKVDKPSVFAKEYQNDPVAGAMRKFHKEDFRYWTIENMQYVLFDDQSHIVSKGDLRTCKAAIACDLAWEEKRESDYSVVVPGFLTPQADLLIDTYICKKGMRPHEIEEILFSMEARLRALTGTSVPIGWEKAKLEKVMQFLLKEAMRRRNHYLMFKPLLWDTDKIQRVLTRLEPRYSQHTVYHRQQMGELEHQLMRFPSGAHDDLPDAMQGLVQLLQYPKSMRKAIEDTDTEWDWWHDQATKALKPERNRFVFGRSNEPYEIPAKASYR